MLNDGDERFMQRTGQGPAVGGVGSHDRLQPCQDRESNGGRDGER